MKLIALWVAAVAAVSVFTLATPAAAQATRTWVSGVGDDANPCSRTAPCKTFAGAISKTAAGGEISVLDPGGFGAVTITKSISIVAEGAEGGVLAAGISGVTVNGPGVVVSLRGLIIEGGASTLGANTAGIRFINGAALHVQNCVIRGFTAMGTNGILFAPTVLAELDVVDTTIANANGAGILVKPTGTGSAKVTLTRAVILNNGRGYVSDGTTSLAGINSVIRDSTIANSQTDAVASVSGASGVTAPSWIMVDGAMVSMNGANGFSATGANAEVRVGRSTITGNNRAGLNTGGTLQSYGTNQSNGNLASDGGFTAVSPS